MQSIYVVSSLEFVFCLCCVVLSSDCMQYRQYADFLSCACVLSVEGTADDGCVQPMTYSRYVTQQGMLLRVSVVRTCKYSAKYIYICIATLQHKHAKRIPVMSPRVWMRWFPSFWAGWLFIVCFVPPRDFLPTRAAGSPCFRVRSIVRAALLPLLLAAVVYTGTGIRSMKYIVAAVVYDAVFGIIFISIQYNIVPGTDRVQHRTQADSSSATATLH